MLPQHEEDRVQRLWIRCGVGITAGESEYNDSGLGRGWGRGEGFLACHAFGLGKGLGKGLGGLGKWFSGMSRCRNMKGTEYNDYAFAAAWG